jgi:hypothetical protein
MNLNKKLTLSSFALLLVALAPVDAATRSGKRYHDGATQLAQEATTEEGAPKRALTAPADVVVEVCETTIVRQLGEDFASSIESAAPRLLEPTFDERIAQEIEQALTRRDAELRIEPVPFGPKTLKETLETNTREAKRLLEETYAHNSKANAKVNLRVHDLLFVIPEPTKSAIGKAARRTASTISWLMGKPTALQQAIMNNDLVAVFKMHITNAEAFYAEINTQGLEDMNSASNTMQNLVEALFGFLGTFSGQNNK